MVPGPSHFLPFGPWSLKCLSIGPRFTAFCPIDLHTPTTTPHKYPFLICHYVFRLKILLQFKLYRFIKMTPPCKTIQNPSSKIQSQKLKLFYLLISIQTRMNIQQGRHESQYKTCRVIVVKGSSRYFDIPMFRCTYISTIRNIGLSNHRYSPIVRHHYTKNIGPVFVLFIFDREKFLPHCIWCENNF